MPGDDKETKSSADSGLSRFSNFIDEHLQSVKLGLYAAGGLTLLGIARLLKVTTKFSSAQAIPDMFYRENVKLRGIVVRRCPSSNILKINHIPAIKSFHPLRSSEESCLDVSLAGLEVMPSGEKWIDEFLVDSTVWFRLLESAHTDSIPAILTHKSKYIPVRVNVNVYLVKKGMARVKGRSETDPVSPIFNRMLNLLKEHQRQAETRGVGDWTRVTWYKRTKARLLAWRNRHRS